MIVNRDPNHVKQIVKTEDEQKENLISELRKESVSIICLALMYAKNLEETGEDITRRLINVNQNADLLQRIYNKGYEEGIAKGRELEREKINKRSNTSINANSFVRPDSIPGPRRDLVQQTNEPHRRKSTKKRHKR